MKFVLGIVLGGLIAAGVYFVLFQSSLFSMEDAGVTGEKAPKKEVAKYSIEPEPQQSEPVVAAATPLPTPKTIAVAKPVEPVVEEMEPEEAWDETDEDYVEDEYDIEEDNRRREIQSLKEALPNNMSIPYVRTPEEVDELLADSEEFNAILEAITDKTATMEERQRYLEMVGRQFDDQIELINYCTEIMADPNSEFQNGLCRDVAESGDQRLEDIENLRRDILKKILQEE